MTDDRRATLYRMATPEHLCPYGLRARDLLRREGVAVEDVRLTSRAAVDAFKARHDVRTTPQVFMGDARIGGYDDLRRYFGRAVRDPKAPSYRPVIAVLAMAALLALAAAQAAFGTPFTPRTLLWFVAFSMCMLAMLKLRDIESFTTTLLGYDLLAQRWLPYAALYAYAEAASGLLMLAHVLIRPAAAIALVIGAIGAVSVVKAVYVEHRDLKCACVGGDSNVKLGAASLTENLLMAAMGVWMLVV